MKLEEKADSLFHFIIDGVAKLEVNGRTVGARTDGATAPFVDAVGRCVIALKDITVELPVARSRAVDNVSVVDLRRDLLDAVA